MPQQAIVKPGSVRFGLLGFGNVGQKVVLKSFDRSNFNIHWIADSKSLISKANGHPFTNVEKRKLIQIKEQYPGRFGEKCKEKVVGAAVRGFESVQQEAQLIVEMTPKPKGWVIIDTATLDGELARTIAHCVMGCACYCTANKSAWTDYDVCAKLYREAEGAHTLLGLNCVAGVWLDQMEILPVVVQQLKSGRLTVMKRDNSSLNLFFEKVASGTPSDKALATIAARGYLEPGPVGLESEVHDQRLKARIAANFSGLLGGFKIDFSDNTLSLNNSGKPASLNPNDIAKWHKSGRRKNLYPALITEINIETEIKRISCVVSFDEVPRGHPLARDFGGKSAMSIQSFDDTEFEWTRRSSRKRSGGLVSSGFGGGAKTAEKLLWEANRAIKLGKSCSMSTFSPIPIIWALANQEAGAKRLKKKLANSL